MRNTPHQLAKRKQWLGTGAILACVGAFGIAAVFFFLDVNGAIPTGLVSDVGAYEEIGVSVLKGQMPYVHSAVEHLPGALVIIIVLTWIAETIDVGLVVIWIPVMALAFRRSVVVIDAIDPGGMVGRQFLVASIPLLPLVLFRLEPWVVLLAVLAIAAYAVDRHALGSIWTVAAALTKGWPIALLAYPWRAGRRWLSGSAAVVCLAVLSLVGATSGFRDARAFTGIHSETLVGNAVLVWRHLSGHALGTEYVAGAVYVSVGPYAVILNMIPGLAVFCLAAYAFATRDTDRRDETVIIGLAVLGIILASPLFSTQFLFWLVPFIAFSPIDIRRTYLAAATIGFATVAAFQPESFIWAVEVLGKNVAVVWLAIVWTRHVRSHEPLYDVSTSRRNLPV